MATRERRLREQPLTIEVENPVAGMRTIVPATALDQRESPLISNFMALYGELQRRPGYTKFGDSSIPLADGPVMQIAPFLKEDGSRKLVAMTIRKIYEWGGAEWAAITQTPGDFTSTDLDKFDFSQNLDLLVYVNGVDEDRKWTGAGNAVIVLANMKSRYCEAWLNRMFFAYVTENGTVRASRLKWHVNGDITDFINTGSGAIDLLDTPGAITGIKKISSGELAIYKPEFVDIAVPTGIAVAPLAVYPGRVEGIGNAAPFSLVDAGDKHIFLSKSGLRSFDGNAEATIAPSIQNALFSGINQERIRTVFAIVRPEVNQYWLWAPSTGAQNPDTLWIIDYEADTAVKGAFPANAAGVHSSAAAPTWTTAEGTWAVNPYGRWDDLNLAAAAPLYVVGLADGGTVQLVDSVATDDGASITAEWQSKDFEPFGGHLVNLKQLDVEAKSSVAAELLCDASTDSGASWIASSPTTRETIDGGRFTTLRFFFNITGERVRFRIKTSSAVANISVRAYSATFNDAGVHLV